MRGSSPRVAFLAAFVEVATSSANDGGAAVLRRGGALRLTVSRGEESLAEFDLEAGERLLGGDEHADLVLPVAVCAGVVAARRPLTHASFVDVGDLRLSLLRVTSRAAVAVERSASVAPPTAGSATILGPRGPPMAVEVETQGLYWRVNLDANAVVFGRGQRLFQDVHRAFVDLGHDHVSRDHCEVHWETGRWFIKDLGSKHGTFHNGRKLASGGGAELMPGDLVELPRVPGGPSFIFSERAKAVSSPRGEGAYSALLGKSMAMRKVRQARSARPP